MKYIVDIWKHEEKTDKKYRLYCDGLIYDLYGIYYAIYTKNFFKDDFLYSKVYQTIDELEFFLENSIDFDLQNIDIEVKDNFALLMQFRDKLSNFHKSLKLYPISKTILITPKKIIAAERLFHALRDFFRYYSVEKRTMTREDYITHLKSDDFGKYIVAISVK